MKTIKLFLMIIPLLIGVSCHHEDQPQPTVPNQPVNTTHNFEGNYKMCTNSPYYNVNKVNLSIQYKQTLVTGEYFYLIQTPEVGTFLSTTTGFYENYKDLVSNRDTAFNTSSANVYFTNLSLKNDTLRIYATNLQNPATYATLLYKKQ